MTQSSTSQTFEVSGQPEVGTTSKASSIVLTLECVQTLRSAAVEVNNALLALAVSSFAIGVDVSDFRYPLA
jgi:hypothetical protein